MTILDGIVTEHIRTHGAITVADFMEIALQHPDHGYYRHGDPLGREGDFITSPEISQMFGEMIGLWCAETWRMMGQPAAFTLMEMGAGRGTLMQDALRATARIAGFHQAMTLCLMESNATLRIQQKEKLAAYHPRYIDDFAQIPQQPLLVISNEFFDALPIRQFEKTFHGWQERMVGLEGDALTFTHAPLDDATNQFIPERMRDANPATFFEINMPAMAMMRKLARQVMQHGGAILTFDYGYVEPSGAPTLQAVARHEYTDVLKNIGDVDLTAHVDFSALRRAAEVEGVKVSDTLGQGDFLRAMGIELRAAQLKQRATPEQMAAIDAALHRLIDAEAMGTLFKVQAAMHPTLTTLPGF